MSPPSAAWRLFLVALAAVLAVATMVGCTSSDDEPDAAPDTTEGGEAGDEDEDLQPVLPDPSAERDFGIADDERANDLANAAIEHFGERFAGTSFDIPDITDDEIDDHRPRMTVHVVGGDDADRTWLRDQAGQIEPEWAELVDVAAVERSLAELRTLLETVLERLADLGESHPVQLDYAGNRIVVDAPTLTPDQRDQLRDGLAPGAVVISDEIVDEDDAGGG